MNSLNIFDLVFQHPERLWWILPIVCLTGVLIILAHRKAIEAFTTNPILRLHSDNVTAPSWRQPLVRFVCSSLLGALLICVYAEPKQKSVIEDPVWGGVRIAFLLDVSLSMKYAHDVHPFPDRLVAAKSVLADFATELGSDPSLRGKYNLAIIPFAGEARSYLSFSESKEEFIEAMDSIDETAINAPGTSLLEAILEYEALWKAYPTKDPNLVDIVVLISDGGKGEGITQEMPQIKATLSRLPSSVTLFTVGVGSVRSEQLPNGSMRRTTVPVPLIIRDSRGGFVEYALEDKDDPNSERLFSELDERTLASVAGGNDRYFFYEGKDQLLAKLKEVIITKRKLERSIPRAQFSDASPWFLIPAFFIASFFFGYFRGLLALIWRPFRGSRTSRWDN
jgi:uncharacterized protein YegL